jgi:hypothetical protein
MRETAKQKGALDFLGHGPKIPTVLDLKQLVREALTDFREVAGLAGSSFSVESIEVQIASKPHKPPRALPPGKMAVYAFFLNGRALKVGKAGPKSAARFASQHYSPLSANSNLAKSILANASALGISKLDESSVGEWIRAHTDRANLLLPASAGIPILSLLESFLHVRWKPVFEGRKDRE